MTPVDTLVTRLRTALMLHDLAASKSDVALAVLVRDALEMFAVDCAEEARAEDVEYEKLRGETF